MVINSIPNYIYFDNAASTINDEQIIKIFVDSTRDFFANPSSIHSEGQRGKHILDQAHDAIRKALNIPNHHVVITSGATEANNLAIKGYCLKYPNRGKHIITTEIEHPSVLEVIKQLCDVMGYSVTYLKPNKEGVISVEQVKNAIKPDTVLVSVMAVNNETGAINPIEEIADMLKAYPKIVFHSDCVQALGKININYAKIDMATITGHKIHGLMGCGALLKKKNIELSPLLAGGGQELGFRSGTNSLAHTVAFAKCVELAKNNMTHDLILMMPLANRLVSFINEHPDLFELNSYFTKVNPYIVNFSLKTKKASVVVEALSNRNIMVSSISACHSQKEKISYVVKAMKDDDALAHNTIRVSFDGINTIDEVEILINALLKIIGDIR